MFFALFLPRAIHEGWRLCSHFMEKTSRLPRSKALSDAKILDQTLFRAVTMVSQWEYSGQRKKMKMGSNQDSISSPPRSSWRQFSQESISPHPAHCGDWHLLSAAAPLPLHDSISSHRLLDWDIKHGRIHAVSKNVDYPVRIFTWLLLLLDDCFLLFMSGPGLPAVAHNVEGPKFPDNSWP